MQPSGDQNARGRWTEEEDQKLLDAVHAHGPKNWGFISEFVPGRTKAQCLQRYTKGKQVPI